MLPYSYDDHALVWERNHEKVRIEPWGRDSLRLRATRHAEIRTDLPHALLDLEPRQVQIKISGDIASIQNGDLRAVVTSEGALRFEKVGDSQLLLEEIYPSIEFVGPSARHYSPAGGELDHIEVRFSAYEGERFYGLGQQQHGKLDQKGCVIDLLQRNTQVSIPFLVSSRGYGFLWNNPAVGRVELGNNGTRWVAEASYQIDYWVTCGNTPAQILERFVEATGHPRMLPDWAAGFWQSRLRYRSQEELLEVAHQYHQLGLPLSVIVIDAYHWTLMGDWKFDPTYWPDPAGMVGELERLGIRVMVSIWPTVNPLSENFSEMEEHGYLVRSQRGLSPHRYFVDIRPEGRAYLYFYDPTYPAARGYVWDKIRTHYYNQGIKVWWLDACEPEILPLEPDTLRFHIASGKEIFNLYPLLHQRTFFEGMQSVGETEIINLSRSAWAGSQRYGTAVWSGDIPSTFEALQCQVRAGLNIGMSGIPWWTTDIGGFHSGDPSTPYFRELIVRWFQYGTFCPLYRLHGYRLPVDYDHGAPNEVWSFGEQAYRIIRELLFLRQRLTPYIIDQMHQAHQHGTPPMRPLFFDFPDDPEAVTVDDQFMFGPDLLVAPVLEQNANSRNVYLPSGSTWTDVWTAIRHPGGQTLLASAPLERIPLYLRNDAHLPIVHPKPSSV